MEALTAKQFLFADFELDASKRRLFKQGEQVALKSKTFDLLLALVQRKGEILTKEQLLDIVWEGQFVEEGNLPVHISALRKIFGEKKHENRFIVTIPGRGYSFVAELKINAGNETFFERHSITQIVVEEEFHETDDSPADIPGLSVNTGSSGWVRQNHRAIIISILAFVMFLGIGGYFLRNAAKKRAVQTFQQLSVKKLTSKGNVSNAALSPDGKLFVYSIPEGDQESLWLGHVDGGEAMQIRPAADLVYRRLYFTPDGSSIYYAVGQNYAEGALYKIPVFGGAPEKIYDNFSGLTFAQDGKQFAFLRRDDQRGKMVLMTADASSANEREIAVLSGENDADWHAAAWSPDGSVIVLAVTSNGEDTKTVVVDVKSGFTTPLGEYSWNSIRAMNWLKDGSGLVAVGIDDKSYLSQLWLISYPDGEVRHLSTNLSEYGSIVSPADNNSILTLEGISQSNIWVAPAENLKDASAVTFGSPGQRNGWNGLVWSPDGRIIYTSNNFDSASIWIMNADGSGQKQLIPSGGVNIYPSVTSDGRFMIFQSNRSGHYAVWRSDLDGGNMVQLTGDQTASQPFVSPDGKWVLYDSDIDATGELWRISIDGGEPVRMTDKLLAWPQISPDSKLVACQADVGGKSKIAILPIDGTEISKMFSTPRLANLRLGVHWTPDGKAVTYRDWANGIWKQNLYGGEPQRLPDLPEEKLFSYGWSPDGKTFAFVRGATSRDVVLMSSLK